MEFDITKLILEIKARKPLWQKDNYNHNCREVINKLWIEVASLMGVSKELVKTKWKGLRDNFRSELRKIPKKHHIHRSKWIYFNDMMFLKDQMTVTKPDVYITGDAEDVNIDVDVYTMDDENENEDGPNDVNEKDYANENFEYRTIDLNAINSTVLTAYPYDKIFSTKYLNLNTDSYEMLPHSTTLTSPDNLVSTTCLDDRHLTNWHYSSDESNISEGGLEKEKNGTVKKRKLGTHNSHDYPINTNDDDFYFLMSLLPTVKTLPPAKKMFLRLKIQQLVYNEVYFNNNNYNNVVHSVSQKNGPSTSSSSE